MTICKNRGLSPVLPHSTSGDCECPHTDEHYKLENDALLVQSSLDYLLDKYPANSWLRRMKDIEKSVLSLSGDELPELTPKQLRHIEAFSLREGR